MCQEITKDIKYNTNGLSKIKTKTCHKTVVNKWTELQEIQKFKEGKKTTTSVNGTHDNTYHSHYLIMHWLVTFSV